MRDGEKAKIEGASQEVAQQTHDDARELFRRVCQWMKDQDVTQVELTREGMQLRMTAR